MPTLASDGIQKIAIDIGYGDTKVAFGDETFKFPTAVARKKESFTEMDDAVLEDVYKYKGKEFIVGERAISEALTTRGIKFLIDYGPLIIKVACEKAGVDMSLPIHVATGLSIKNWNERSEFTQAIASYAEEEGINIKEINLYPQGHGILRDTQTTGENIVVVDVGYNTLDFLYFEKGRPNKEESFANENGANKVVSKLQAAIGKENSSLRLTEQQVKNVVTTGQIKIRGEIKDYKSKVREFLLEYSEDTLGELENSKKNLMDLADKVIFSGGGANFILRSDDMPKHYIQSPKPFEFSNVRGYLKLLKGE